MENVVFTQLSIPELRKVFRQELVEYFGESQPLASPSLILPELLTRREAADLAGVCLATLDNKVRDGVLKKYRTGGIVRFKRQEIIEAFSQPSLAKGSRRGIRSTGKASKT